MTALEIIVLILLILVIILPIAFFIYSDSQENKFREKCEYACNANYSVSGNFASGYRCFCMAEIEVR